MLPEPAPDSAATTPPNGACLAEAEVAAVLAALATRWEAWPPAEQARLVSRLVERIDYDGAAGQVAVTFHATCLLALTQEWACPIRENHP